MDATGRARQRREQAAAMYRPERIRLLLVGEAPPAAVERYFYFENVHEQDGLFRYVVRTVLDQEPSRAEKTPQLRQLKDCGVFLIDLKPDPKIGDESLERFVDDLVARAVALKPQHVITIKANVCSLTQGPLRASGLDVVRERVPFPGSGQQTRFVEAMGRALTSIAWAD